MDDIFDMYTAGLQQGFMMDTILVRPDIITLLRPQADWIIRLGIEMGLERAEVEYYEHQR